MKPIIKMLAEQKNINETFKKAIKQEDTFICEICHCETPKRCEGAEPNTCAMCMPCENPSKMPYIERNMFD